MWESTQYRQVFMIETAEAMHSRVTASSRPGERTAFDFRQVTSTSVGQ